MMIRKFYDLADWGSGGFAKPVLSAVAKVHVVEYWSAVLDDGEEIPIKKEDAIRLGLKDGQTIEGLVKEEYVQNRYADGTYARSYTVNRRFEVEGNCT